MLGGAVGGPEVTLVVWGVGRRGWGWGGVGGGAVGLEVKCQWTTPGGSARDSNFGSIRVTEAGSIAKSFPRLAMRFRSRACVFAKYWILPKVQAPLKL